MGGATTYIKTAGSEAGTRSRLDDIRVGPTFSWLHPHALILLAFLHVSVVLQALALLPGPERSGCGLFPFYAAEVVSDACHGFDTCKLEGTKATLNGLGTPTNHFEV